ncbi:hypothetical protein [Vibrio splendidus]|uniref:hypothetical protein n=1 Tax=Vibrio splendidus TaxID=29497 RepID=UPI0011B72128|nr:hypothetical protein [Vibrio splendidus]
MYLQISVIHTRQIILYHNLIEGCGIECTEETELDNYTYIDITALETVAVFLHEELTCTTNY